MKGHMLRRLVVYMGCMIYLNACDVSQTAAVERGPASIDDAFIREEIELGGGETNYEELSVAVQEEHLGKVTQDESSDFFDP